MKSFLTGLLCALILNSLCNGQEQPESSRPTGGRRGGVEARPAPHVAGRQIMLDMLIADVAEALDNPTAPKVLELEKTGKLTAATRLRMATLDELPGFILLGGRGGRTTMPGARGGPGGPPATDRGGFGTPASTNTGIQFQATPRIEDDGSVVTQIYVERPEFAVPLKVMAADASDEARRNFSFLSQNTVRLKSGEAKLISGRQSAAGNERSQTWIVVTASVEGEAAGNRLRP